MAALGILVFAWSLALQAVALRSGVVGLHVLPRWFPRAAWPALLALASALVGFSATHTAGLHWYASLFAAAPVGALSTLLLSATVRRRPEARWLAAQRAQGTTPACHAESLRLAGDPGAGATLLMRTAQASPALVVVFLHGGGNDRFFGLSYLFEKLLGRGHAVLTADLAGHGRQGRDRFTLQACRRRADRLVALAQQRFPAARVVLLGQSLGAALALDRVARGLFCDGVAAVSAPARLRLGARLWSELRALGRPAIYRALCYGNLLEVLPAAGSFKRAAYPVRLAHAGCYVEAFARAIGAMDLPRRLQRASVHGASRVLLVQGAWDGVVPLSDTRALRSALGDRAEARLFERVTHLDPLLDRNVVAELVAWMEGEGR